MNDSKVDDILNSLEGAQRAALPADFQASILLRWHESSKDKKINTLVYWAAASLLAFTLMNGWAMFALSSSQEDTSETTALSSETQFTEEYKLVKTSDYYTFNETVK